MMNVKFLKALQFLNAEVISAKKIWKTANWKHITWVCHDHENTSITRLITSEVFQF